MKTGLGSVMRRLAARFGYTVIKTDLLQGDMERDFFALHQRTENFSLTTTANQYALYQAVRYIVQAHIPGDFVECGVWRGGSSMMVALALQSLGVKDRHIHLYDTFRGMSPPEQRDVDYADRPATAEYEARGGKWVAASLEEVQKNLFGTGYPPDKLRFIKGDVALTLPAQAPEQIALLRLDTDWYASTYQELQVLYPRLARGGILLIDDYGYFKGAREAVDQYLSENKLELYLSRIDIGARIVVKPQTFMRILHAISGIDPQNGGPTAALVGLTEAQVRCGLDVTVAATWQIDEAFETARRLQSAGVKVEMIGRASGKLSRHSRLAETMRRLIGAADVVHVHAVWEQMQYEAARIARQAGKPYVMTPHGMLDAWNMRTHNRLKRLYFQFRLRRLFDAASAIHLTTQIEAESVARWRFKAPTFVEPLGLDWREFDPRVTRGAFRASVPELRENPYVVFLGRLHRGKGAELLIPAFAQADVPGAMLVLAGPDSGGFRRMLEALVTRHALQSRVIFTGMLTGRRRLEALADSELLALPSWHENFGLAVVEALAVGRPVIVSDQVNLHREIREAGVGDVTPLEVGALAGALRRWLTNAEMRAAAAEKARAFARSRFDWDVIARHWVDHYRRVIGA